jgi:hypothetical protein
VAYKPSMWLGLLYIYNAGSVSEMEIQPIICEVAMKIIL